MGVPDIVKMAARSVGLSSAICRNAASRTRGRSPGARWTSSNRYATKRSGTATAWPFASPGETGLPGVALAMSGGLPPVFFHREARDFLRLAFVEELETRFGEVVDRDSVDIADHHRDHDEGHMRIEGWRRLIASVHLGGVGIGRSLRWWSRW